MDEAFNLATHLVGIHLRRFSYWSDLVIALIDEGDSEDDSDDGDDSGESEDDDEDMYSEDDSDQEEMY